MRYKEYVYNCRKKIRQTGKLKNVAKCPLINGPTLTEGVLRTVETWASYEDLPPEAKGRDGQRRLEGTYSMISTDEPGIVSFQKKSLIVIVSGDACVY